MRNINALWQNARFRRNRAAAITSASSSIVEVTPPITEVFKAVVTTSEPVPAHGGMTVTVDQLMALYLGGHSSLLLGDEQLSLQGDLSAHYGLGTLMLSEQMPAGRHPISRNSTFVE
jgi:hypothetical protein